MYLKIINMLVLTLQTLALEWVRDNIKLFGGNPNEVTLMGESAGASSVALHYMSPLSCGLFKRAILQSTGATPRWGYVSQTEALKRSRKLAKEVGCTYHKFDVEKTLKCLRGKPSTKILSKEYNVATYGLNLFPFVPTIDDNFLSQSPRSMLENENFINTSILIGSNTNEGYWSLMYLLPDLFPNKPLNISDLELSEEQYIKAVQQIFSFYPKKVSVP